MKTLDIQAKKDHLESLTKIKNSKFAIEEMIWNALDADATSIDIDYHKSEIGVPGSITFRDNGHGIYYNTIESSLGVIGGSLKKLTLSSPNGRPYHGKEGKGRFKAFALGTLLNIETIYLDPKDGQAYQYQINWDFNNIQKPTITVPEKVSSSNKIGTTITIRNIVDKKANSAFTDENILDITEIFSVYKLNHPDVLIKINGEELKIEAVIKKSSIDTQNFEITTGEQIELKFKIIEWKNKTTKNSIYLCRSEGVPLSEHQLYVRNTGGLPLSIYVSSEYVNELQHLELANFDNDIGKILELARQFAKDYIRQRLAEDANTYISELKSQKLYPYKNEATNANQGFGIPIHRQIAEASLANR